MKTPILLFVLVCITGAVNVFANCYPLSHAFLGEVSSPESCKWYAYQTITVYQQIGVHWSDNAYTLLVVMKFGGLAGVIVFRFGVLQNSLIFNITMTEVRADLLKWQLTKN